MSLELDDLYREVILDHYRTPRGAAPLPDPDVREEGFNPLCGDELTLELDVEGGVIRDLSVRSRGCSISVASGSLLAEALRGRTLAEARQLLAGFKAMMQGQPPADGVEMGDLEVLEGVKNFPVRIKCALLAWTTLEQALSRVEPT
jgi:nitrogen fixation protein NifU and related proteins